jgi:beta-catenin-like protein 1
MIGKEKALITWLLERIQKPEKPTTQNKQYASELLSILTQSSRPNRTLIADTNGVELFLTNLAPYRRDDPEKDSDEEEYMENLFNCLTSIVEEPIGKTKFLEAEGAELCLLLVRDGKTSKSRALKVLDHACGYAEAPASKGSSTDDTPAPPHIAVCEKLIEARGLKPLFSTFMKTKRPDPSQTEHILGIFSSLLRSLPGNSDARFRLLAKFTENDFAKISKLVALRREYVTRLSTFDKSIASRKDGLSAEEQEELEVENTPLRLSEGLYALQRIDATLAWLVAEDEGAKKAVVMGLAETDETLADVKKTLKAQLDGVLEVEAAEREVLEALVGFLD